MISPRTIAKLLVGIDFSDCCERALRHAITLAERNQAQLELLHVVELEKQRECDGPTSPDPASSSLWGAKADQARSCLGRRGQLCSQSAAARRLFCRLLALLGSGPNLGIAVEARGWLPPRRPTEKMD